MSTLFFFRVFCFFLNRITRHHLITLYDPSSASRASQRDAARDDETTQSASLHVDVDNEKTGNNLEGLFLYQSIFLSLKGWQKTNVFFRLAHTLFPQLICIHHTSGEVTGWWSRRDTLKIGRRKIFPSFNSPGGGITGFRELWRKGKENSYWRNWDSYLAASCVLHFRSYSE